MQWCSRIRELWQFLIQKGTHTDSASSDPKAIAVLCSEGKNMLVPRPLFTAYEAMAAVSGVEIRYYDLLPEQEWECDLNSIESLIDENTACLILTNPGNPCGSNYSASHLKALADLMARRQVVVIADEGQSPSASLHL